MAETAPHPMQGKPGVPELYLCSLIATALVYIAGVLLFSALSFFGVNNGGWQAVGQLLVLGLVWGVIPAAAAALMLIAPLGTALGLLVLRITPAGWWQGPVTGALVALSLEALVLLLFASGMTRNNWDWGNVVTLSIPVVLAMIAGAIVQRRVLRWPDRLTLSASAALPA